MTRVGAARPRRPLVVAAVLLGLALSQAGASAQERGGDGAEKPPVGAGATKASIAVLDLSFEEVIRSKKARIVRGPASAELGAGELRKVVEGEATRLTDEVVAALVKSRKLEVIERERTRKITNEQILGESGEVLPTKAVEIGKRLGADYLVLGSIAFHEISEKFDSIPGTNRWRRSLKAQIDVDIRLVDSTTGRVIDRQRGHGAHDSEEPSNGPEALDLPGDFMDTVHRKLVEDLARKVIDGIYPMKVLAFTDDVITINRGEGTGLVEGQWVEIFMVGEEMIDPDTGETLGSEEIKLCEAQVIAILPKYSKARVSGRVADVPRGSVVRLKGSGRK